MTVAWLRSGRSWSAIQLLDGELARRLTVSQITDAVEWLIEAKAELEAKEQDQ